MRRGRVLQETHFHDLWDDRSISKEEKKVRKQKRGEKERERHQSWRKWPKWKLTFHWSHWLSWEFAMRAPKQVSTRRRHLQTHNCKKQKKKKKVIKKPKEHISGFPINLTYLLLLLPLLIFKSDHQYSNSKTGIHTHSWSLSLSFLFYFILFFSQIAAIFATCHNWFYFRHFRHLFRPIKYRYLRFNPIRDHVKNCRPTGNCCRTTGNSLGNIAARCSCWST